MNVTLITRDKNTYSFEFGNKKALINLDNESEPIIGLSGKPVKKVPNYIREFELGRIIASFLSKEDIEPTIKEFIDRLISLPIDFKTKLQAVVKDSPFEALSNWKEYLKYLKEFDKYRNFHDYVRYQSIISQFSDKDLINFLRSSYSSRPIPKMNKVYRHDILYAFNITKRIEKFKQSLPSDDIMALYGYTWVAPNIEWKISSLLSKVSAIENFRKTINDTEVKGIEEDFDRLNMAYEQEKNRIDNEDFLRHQSQINLSYETEKYKIIVPYSREDLSKYGDIFKNCLNRWEWNNRLSNHQYYCAIVYDKELEKEMVCLDIHCSNRKIDQYYGYSNFHIQDRGLLNFKKEYQNYLLSL